MKRRAATRGEGRCERNSVADTIKSVQEGLPFAEFKRLRAVLQISSEELASYLGISAATLHRRQVEGRLTSHESDRLLRYRRLWEKAVFVFEDPQEALSWLTTRAFGLGGEIPLDFARTEVGAREVEDLIGRIQYSVYS